jgi:hypothetical protein
MTEDQKATVHRVLESFLSNGDHRLSDLQPLARKHRLLPIFPDWSGFIGLSEGGEMFWVSTEDEVVRREADPHFVHLARIRGAALFVDLAFLRPDVAADWVVCATCEGTGKPMYRGQPMAENVSCQCGGVGRLPSDLAELLRERAKVLAG